MFGNYQFQKFKEKFFRLLLLNSGLFSYTGHDTHRILSFLEKRHLLQVVECHY